MCTKMEDELIIQYEEEPTEDRIEAYDYRAWEWKTQRSRYEHKQKTKQLQIKR